ncbi:MAG: C40 family peptidase [Gemmatimonadota bacterium]|nr:C40 family peptidase [Gemmatimonadota bacterium]
MQAVFALHGFSLPRDAWQQAAIGTDIAVGSLSATNTLRDFAVGDLLFFSDRDDKRLTHVGIAMADNQFIHSGIRRGGVNVEQLDSDEAYVRQLRSNFVCAKRVAAGEASSP